MECRCRWGGGSGTRWLGILGSRASPPPKRALILEGIPKIRPAIHESEAKSLTVEIAVDPVVRKVFPLNRKARVS
jgi:hypothetical protein